MKTMSKRAAMTQGTGMCSLGKPPWHCLAPGTALLSLLRGVKPNLPFSAASDRTRPQSPNKLSTPIAITHSTFVPLLSHLAENVLALDVDHTYQGLDPAVPGLGRQHRFMAQITWSTPCSAKLGGSADPSDISYTLTSGLWLFQQYCPPWQWVFGSWHLSSLREKSSLCKEPCLGISA